MPFGCCAFALSSGFVILSLRCIDATVHPRMQLYIRYITIASSSLSIERRLCFMCDSCVFVTFFGQWCVCMHEIAFNCLNKMHDRMVTIPKSMLTSFRNWVSILLYVPRRQAKVVELHMYDIVFRCCL